MAANFYPPCPQPNLTLGLSPHWDNGGLTLLVQNVVDGLQVKHKGRWVAARPTPGMFTVILGNYMEVLSNGRYKSVQHRTRVNKERMRITVAVGHRPENDAIMAPAHQLVEKDGGLRFKSLRFGDYMKLQQTIVSEGKHALKTLAFQQDTAVMPSQSADERAVE
ncbi:Oxoglutarate/iron-dependent dioxygenase [Cinnamomum micranthum f. kanehirae]|uniref:Oxoglutarate/iron-dependent dioxygenase n=1 Tax=Cinnamomum micranthum f. kanehirae TaxID=337451 RepID=A0A443Q494_9MAGN|nr:Oxoglutarate/iron-dependent dioxygenase [Cinnamomum micranthum f. kanehirae]